MTDISQSRMAMEQNIQRITQGYRNYHRRQLLYLEIDASGVGLVTGLLEVRDHMNCAQNEAPDNAVT